MKTSTAFLIFTIYFHALANLGSSQVNGSSSQGGGSSTQSDSCDSKLNLNVPLPFDTTKLNCLTVWNAQGYILRVSALLLNLINFNYLFIQILNVNTCSISITIATQNNGINKNVFKFKNLIYVTYFFFFQNSMYHKSLDQRTNHCGDTWLPLAKHFLTVPEICVMLSLTPNFCPIKISRYIKMNNINDKLFNTPFKYFD